MTRDYWVWLGPLLLAMFGLFLGVLLGTATLTQMLLWPAPLLHTARQPGAIVGSLLCLVFPILMVVIALLSRRPGWLKNGLAFFVAGFVGYVVAAFTQIG